MMSNSTLFNNGTLVPSMDLEFVHLFIKITIIIMTVLPNLLILIMVKLITKKNYTDYLFMSKSVADLIVGTFSLPFMTIYTTFKYWPLKQFVCIFWVINDYSSCTVSIFNLLLVTIQRFQHLIWPLHTSEKINKIKVCLIAGTWILAYMFWSISVLIIYLQKDPNSTECYFSAAFIFILLSDIFVFILPISILVILSFLTIIALVKRAKMKDFLNLSSKFSNQIQPKFTSNSGSTDNSKSNGQMSEIEVVNVIKKRNDKEKKAVICIFMVLINLVLCWIIFFITWPMASYCVECVSPVLFEYGYWLTYIHSTINPYILFIFHNNFRNEIKKFLIKLKKCLV